MFDNRRRKIEKQEWTQARTRATAAMVAGKGFYNTSPWSFAFGIAVAIFATLFTLDWVLRDTTEPKATPVPQPPALPSDEIIVDLE